MKLLPQKKPNNRGFTLIEVIVVVVIISIVAAVSVPGISSLLNSNVTKAASKLNSVCMRTRTITMSSAEGSIFLTVYMKDENYYAEIFKFEAGNRNRDKDYQTVDEPVFLGNNSLSLYELGGGKITDANPFYVQFEKGSGAFKSKSKGIKMSGSGRDIKLYFVQDTGRTYMESS